MNLSDSVGEIKDKNFDIFDNSITLVKYVAAIQVLVKHLIIHFKLDIPTIIYRFIDVFSGVPIFFCFSGFLIAHSLSREWTQKEYFKKRFFRIYPELMLIIVIDAVCLIIFKPSLIKEPIFWFFNFLQSTLYQGWTPDLLRFYGVSVPNGSLWTMQCTIPFYIIIYYLYPKVKNKSHLFHISIILVGMIFDNKCFMLQNYMPSIIFSLLSYSIIRFFHYFYIGVYFYIYKDTIVKICRKYFWIVLIFVIEYDFFLGYFKTSFEDPIKIMLLSMLAIGASYRFNKIKIKKDYSFGIYLWHMVFINIFVHLKIFNNLIGVIIVFTLSFLFAMLSGELTIFINRKIKNKNLTNVGV